MVRRVNIKLYVFIGLCASVCLSTVLILHQDLKHRPVRVAHNPDLRQEYETRPTNDHVVVTLFTAFTERTPLYELTIENRVHFKPHIRPVLFTTFQNNALLAKARELGWALLPLNRTNYYNQAFIRDMFQAAYHFYDSTFYVYADGDIMFDLSLPKTMAFLDGEIRAGNIDVRRLFGVGMKTTVHIDGGNLPPFSKINLVSELATRVSPKDERAMDYIVTGRYGIEWRGIPDLVADRFGCGTRLFASALERGMTTIDLTRTLHAVHLVAINHHTQHDVSDDLYNVQQGDSWDFEKGNINYTQWQAILHKDGTMSLHQRQRRIT